MPRHIEKINSIYTADQLMQLILDVEKYPEFLPWCLNSRITSRLKHNELEAELTIGYKQLRQRYISRIRVDNRAKTIDVIAIRGPFSKLQNTWKFTSLDSNCSEINFLIDFEFKSVILSKIMDVIFFKAMKSMVKSFTDRADSIYKGKRLSA